MRFRILANTACCFIWLGLCAAAGPSGAAPSGTAGADPVQVWVDVHASPRVTFGAERLVAALTAAGTPASIVHGPVPGPSRTVVIGDVNSPETRAALQPGPSPAELAKGEGFLLRTCQTAAGKRWMVVGSDDSGELYGCLRLAETITATGRLPDELDQADAPAFKLRGACIGMQKPYLLPGRHVYEYPYTPELFPFFYDKQFWQRYLDFLVQQRMNTLYLWSGHPFASLVKLPDYPYALEVPEDVFQKNAEMFRYVAAEADKRGIWVVQMFYNILVSQPFAEHNHIKTQLAAPTPLVADYTRKSIAEFVRQYPHVGLMICLGEALQGTANQTDWLVNTIIPGVRDGMATAGLTDEPPLIIRTQATDLRVVMPPALKVYRNLYTEAKYTGESLTTSEPRGKWQQIHLAMSRLGSTHVVNVHILANLEPFRYGDQRFIQQCVQASRDRLGAKGIHLYPLCYWNWPDAPDRVDPPLAQIDRDWIWYEAWARYAWDPDVAPDVDHAYWIDRIAAHYGRPAAEDILAAYNDSGECAPRLIRRFGITEGNRQTLSLGMTLDQLVKPEKYNELPDLWESDAPPGERLREYADREWAHQGHTGETPPQIIREVLDYSQKAVEEVDAAAPAVTADRAEFERLRNDVHCIRAMSLFYAAKANAALLVLRYGHSHEASDLRAAEPFLGESLEAYRQLAELGDPAYLFANSMQTNQRKIPVSGGSGGHPANYLWGQLLPVYEKELTDFRVKVRQAYGAGGAASVATVAALPRARVTILSGGEAYRVTAGAAVFTDRAFTIRSLAPELNGLTGVRFSQQQAKAGQYVPVAFHVDEPVQVLIGYFRSHDPAYLQPPSSEFDAAAAERGSTEAVIEDAASIPSLPPVDVYTQFYPAGDNKLEMHGTGSFIVLGVVPRSANIAKVDAEQRSNPPATQPSTQPTGNR